MHDRREKCLPLIASWAKYLTSMSVSVASFSSTGFTSVWRALWDKDRWELLNKLSMLVLFFFFSVIAYLCHCWQKTCDADKDNILAVKDGANLLKGLGHIEAYIGHLVIGHLEDHWQHLLSGDFLATCFWQSLRHIIGMVTNDAESEKHSKILDKCFF